MGGLKGITTKMAAQLEVTSATTQDGGGEGRKSLKMPIWRATCLTFQGWRRQAHAPWVRTKKGGKLRTSLRLDSCLHANLTPTLSQRDLPCVSSCADSGCGLSGGLAGAGQAPTGSNTYASVPLALCHAPPLLREDPAPCCAVQSHRLPGLPPLPSSPGKWRKTQNHQGRTVGRAA